MMQRRCGKDPAKMQQGCNEDTARIQRGCRRKIQPVNAADGNQGIEDDAGSRWEQSKESSRGKIGTARFRILASYRLVYRVHRDTLRKTMLFVEIRNVLLDRRWVFRFEDFWWIFYSEHTRLEGLKRVLEKEPEEFWTHNEDGLL